MMLYDAEPFFYISSTQEYIGLYGKNVQHRSASYSVHKKAIKLTACGGCDEHHK
jgi:hypothetical protein